MPKPLIRIFKGKYYREIPEEDGLTCSEFASLINASDETVRRWVKAGLVAALPGFTEIRILFAEVAAKQAEAERFAISVRLAGREPSYEFRKAIQND